MKITRLLLALIALTSTALAQQDPDPAKLTLAREAIAAMKIDKMFDGMAAQMKQMAMKMTSDMLPAEATAEDRKIVEEFQGKVMDLSMESAKDIIVQMDQVYADVYSVAELQAMITFFKSPEGQSMLAKQPQVMQRIMPFAQSMQRDLMPKIEQLTKEMKAKLELIHPTTPATPANP